MCFCDIKRTFVLQLVFHYYVRFYTEVFIHKCSIKQPFLKHLSIFAERHLELSPFLIQSFLITSLGLNYQCRPVKRNPMQLFSDVLCVFSHNSYSREYLLKETFNQLRRLNPQKLNNFMDRKLILEYLVKLYALIIPLYDCKVHFKIYTISKQLDLGRHLQ